MSDNEVTMGFITQSDIRKHLTGIKWVSITFMFAVLFTIPGIIIISLQPSQHLPDKLTEKIDVFNEPPNDTACIYVKQYHLSNYVFATVCNLNGYIVVDLRQFINNTATIKGIQLNIQQWLSLKQMSRSIDVAIAEARTYWKHLKEQQNDRNDA